MALLSLKNKEAKKSREIQRVFILFIFVFLFLFFFSGNTINAETFYKNIKRPGVVHNIYFKGTDYELNVYKIYGRKDGKTMLIVGGIQGDELGGFLSADLYVDLKLDEGNLIIVPRANFKSIINNKRGTDGDMNRRFHKDSITNKMDEVVSIIKELIASSDVFLHLHDGWGFHSTTYQSKERNPKRFGQSIIVDTDLYHCDNRTDIDLKSLAERALDEINNRIGVDSYFMHYFNTETTKKTSKFPEMKKTATFYALKKHCIPSFGIETSKNLPTTEMKVLYHNYAINAFMKLFEIEPMQPPIFLIRPEFKYAIVEVNGEPKYIKKGDIINVSSGDQIEVTHLESNYARGLSCDIVGFGSLNDYLRQVQIKADTFIIIKKDNEKVWEIPLKVSTSHTSKYYVFLVEYNGKLRYIGNGETLKVKTGDNIKVIKGFGDSDDSASTAINVKGFVPHGIIYNTGDDRDFDIVIGKNFIIKHSKDGRGKVYPVIAGDDKLPLGEFLLEITK